MKLYKLFGVAVLAALILVAACGQVDFTAPTGSTITITVQPPTIAANGFSNVTVTGTRANGAPLPDGTVITFTSNLGTVTPNPVETKDGVAISRFRAGTRSGTATITARSGEAAEVTADVIIGEVRAARISLVATPIQLPVGGGKVNLKAHVFDDQGNPLSGVGVIFTTTSGELESNGRVIKSNDSGTSMDVLRTTIAATVTAESQQGAATDTADVTIGERVPCEFFISPSTNVFVGQTVTFTDNSGNSTGLRFLWDFGDGTTGEGQVVTHSYDVVASYTVVHTVIDSEGFSSVCSNTVNVESGAPVCSFTFSPESPTEGNQVSFDASGSTDPSNIASYTWNFGDGTTQTTSNPFINHVYNFPGCNAGGSVDLTVGLIVTDNQGQTNSCNQGPITIDCN